MNLPKSSTAGASEQSDVLHEGPIRDVCDLCRPSSKPSSTLSQVSNVTAFFFLVHTVASSSSTHAARQTTLSGSISDRLDQHLFTDEN